MTLTIQKATPDSIARRYENELRLAVQAALKAFRSELDLGTLSELVNRRQFTEVIRLLEESGLGSEARRIRDVLARTAQASAQTVALTFDLSFNLVNPRAAAWALNYSGELIQGLTQESLDAVRGILNLGQTQGINVRNQGRMIRDVIGLTERQGIQLARFTQGALESMIETQAFAAAERLRNRLIADRSLVIARTETMTAANQGLQEGWNAARDEGLIPGNARKVWIATDDERTCPICSVLDGETVGFEDEFVSTERATAFDRGLNVAETAPLREPVVTEQPPAHPGCRCTTGLVFD